MIKALLVDDELNGIKNLENILNRYFSDKVLVSDVANSVDEAFLKFEKNHPELIFLDIEMPEKNGFELLKQLGNKDFEVIFVTAFSEYGIDAIKFSALDYILKPVDINDLRLAIDKAISKIKNKKYNQSIENLLEYFKNENDKTKHKIAISSAKETRFVLVSEIIRCESKNSYTFIYLKNGEEILSSTAIHEYEILLENYDFLRCHQSHLVNKNFVKSMIKNQGDILCLENNFEVPISRQKKDWVKKKLISN